MNCGCTTQGNPFERNEAILVPCVMHAVWLGLQVKPLDLKIRDIREGIINLLDACFCDDGRGLPECDGCLYLRKVLELVERPPCGLRLAPETPFTKDELKTLQGSPFKGPDAPWPEKQNDIADCDLCKRGSTTHSHTGSGGAAPVSHCYGPYCRYMTERRCICLCSMCGNAKAKDH